MFKEINKTLRAQFKGCGYKITTGVAGSFLFVKIDDPDGTAPAKLCWSIVKAAGVIFEEKKYCKSRIPMQGMAMNMDGLAVIANWTIHF